MDELFENLMHFAGNGLEAVAFVLLLVFCVGGYYLWQRSLDKTGHEEPDNPEEQAPVDATNADSRNEGISL
jgi:hypothetical protein